MVKKVLVLVGLLVVVGLVIVLVQGGSGTREGGPQSDTFYKELSAEPENLNPLSSTDLYSRFVYGKSFDGLATVNPDTYEMEPALAERWDISDDGMVFTFYLREAYWHDGEPVTAQDVKFSFDAIFDDRFRAARSQPYFENIEKAEVIDDRTVRFTAKEQYFNNFRVLASGGFLTILPEHVYGDPENRMTREMVGSGPYIMEDYDRGRSITMRRNDNWWGFDQEHLKGLYPVERIYFRIVREENLRLDMLRRGRLDLGLLTPEAYVRRTEGGAWGKTVLKQKVENLSPKSYNYVGWNLENDLFKDRRVRIALAHLMDRATMNERFRYGMSLKQTGPWYRQNPFADQNVEPIRFDPEKAQELLREAGWDDTNQSGTLNKEIDGRDRQFRFTLLLANRDNEKYMTHYKEDLKRAGIDMTIRVVEWNSMMKAMDERNFEAVMLGWGGGSVDVDPKQIWHSEATRAGGSNFIGYRNPEVDRLIDEARMELDRDLRIEKLQEVFRQVAADAPYAFMFVDQYELYAHSSRMAMEKPTYKYGIGEDYWWIEQ